MDHGERSSTREEWREQVAKLRSRLSSQITDKDELLTLLLGPLDLLDLLPEEVRDQDGEVRIHARWTRLQLGPAYKDDAVRHFRWIADIQSTLLLNVLPDWKDVLEQDDLLVPTLRQWFSPLEKSRHEPQEAAGAVAICSLSTFTSLLSAKVEVDPQGKRRRETLMLVQRALESFLQNVNLVDIVQHCQALQRTAALQPDLIWSDALRNLLSLPDRIANAFEGRIPDALTDARFQAYAGVQVGCLVQQIDLPERTSTLVGRLLRAGWVSDTRQWTSSHFHFWPALLHSIANAVAKEGFSDAYIGRWSSCVGGLVEEEQTQLLRRLVTTLDQYCLRPSHMADLLNGSEALRSGAEGTAFLSERTWQAALQIASIVKLFIVAPDEDEEGSLSAILVNTAAGARAWSPLMTRILVHLLLESDPTFERCDAILQQGLKRWAQQARTASWDEEVYRTTLLALLVESAPSTSSSVSTLATLPTFIQGVSTHLEHLSPRVRRLGMLLAEMVSAKSGKSLTFGRRIWDGRGEGREEARVLRAAAIGFPSRRKVAKSKSKDEVLDALHLSVAPQVVAVSPSVTLRHARTSEAPKSRVLPERRPAPSRALLIEEVDQSQPATLGSSEGQDALPSLLNISGRAQVPKRGGIAPLSDDEKDSSGSDGEDSSSDEDLRKEAGATKEAAAEEEGKAFGSATPSNKKKARAPIYVNELAPLLRSNEYDSVRMGLKQAEALITRKAGWGGEVDENAVDVCLALCALQNNFGLRQFDERRLAALTALVTASPSRIAPYLAEQYFVHQYSLAQRIAILNALAFAAVELATGKRTTSTPSIEKMNGQSAASKMVTPHTLADDLAQMAMTRARKEGEERMPEIRREKTLLVNSQSPTLAKANDVTRPIAQHANRFLALASCSFLFPLLGRLWSHLQDGGVSAARRSRFMGSGSGIIDMPFMMGALLDTLAVLCYYAQNELRFRNEVVPDVLQLVMMLTRVQLAEAASGAALNDGEEVDGGSRATVLGAGASLVLVCLDATWQLDGGALLSRQQAVLLGEVQHWAAAIFEAAQGATADRSVGALDRSGRSSAAILLRINEMQERQKGGSR